jgi:hypothetical protein
MRNQRVCTAIARPLGETIRKTAQCRSAANGDQAKGSDSDADTYSESIEQHHQCDYRNGRDSK